MVEATALLEEVVDLVVETVREGEDEEAEREEEEEDSAPAEDGTTAVPALDDTRVGAMEGTLVEAAVRETGATTPLEDVVLKPTTPG